MWTVCWTVVMVALFCLSPNISAQCPDVAKRSLSRLWRRRELSETILDSGDTLLTILGDILDFSKIDHNSMVLESAPVRSADPSVAPTDALCGACLSAPRMHAAGVLDCIMPPTRTQ